MLLSRLEADIFPRIGPRPIAEIDAPELLEVLRKVENRRVIKTARRLRQICGQVFRYAVATGRGEDDPTTVLRGALGAPPNPRGHAAMALKELPEFLSALEAYDGDPRTRLALRLMVLTFVRTIELRAARWSEFENLDGSNALWRIPADRMKMKREHVVPLASQAMAVLRQLRALPGAEASPFLFPSLSREGYMSNNTMPYAMYRMGYHGRATVHGFRAMASTALNEMGFRADVIERQLAHEEQNAVRAAYNRAEYLAERRSMMNHWADHLGTLFGENLVRLQPVRDTLIAERHYEPAGRCHGAGSRPVFRRLPVRIESRPQCRPHRPSSRPHRSAWSHGQARLRGARSPEQRCPPTHSHAAIPRRRLLVGQPMAR